MAKDPKSSAPTEASNAPKQEKVLASSELSTEASPASNGKQASTVKTKRRPKSKKADDKSSLAVPVLEAISVEESSNSVTKPKHSSSKNRKPSSAKVFLIFCEIIVLALLTFYLTSHFSEGGGKVSHCGGAQKWKTEAGSSSSAHEKQHRASRSKCF